MQDYSHSTKKLKKLILFFLVALYPILRYDSVTLVLAINSSHKPLLDSIATTITLFGSLWFYILFLGMLVLCKRTIMEVLFAGISFFNTCIIVQIFKHIVFGALPRPIDTINPDNLHLVENFSHDHYNSFPSGHASTVFVIASVLCILMINKSIYLHIVLLFFASLVAMSRVYLAMHFYHDVYAGAFIGCTCTTLTYYGINKIQWPAWTYNNFLDIIKLFFMKNIK